MNCSMPEMNKFKFSQKTFQIERKRFRCFQLFFFFFVFCVFFVFCCCFFFASLYVTLLSISLSLWLYFTIDSGSFGSLSTMKEISFHHLLSGSLLSFLKDVKTWTLTFDDDFNVNTFIIGRKRFDCTSRDSSTSTGSCSLPNDTASFPGSTLKMP